MNEVVFYTLLSVTLVSIISLIGVVSLSVKADKLKKILIYFISFSAGALFADAFLHLIPEIVEEGLFNVSVGFFILAGIILFFIIEKMIHWQHCHMPITENHVHSFAYMNLIGDGLHNFIDGLIIAASYLISIPVGIATTIAVVLHEIPQEIGDFGVLLHGGFSRGKALFMNFGTALLAVAGAVVGLILSGYIEGFEVALISIAAGGFIYIAGSDLIPELHKETKFARSLIQLISFIAGIGVMAMMLLME
jgi:zinc and cadmium transporter